MSDKRLIVALDYSTLDDVKKLVARLGDHVGYYKVGMELYYSAGEKVIAYLKEKGKDIFLDLKLHDIPNTVAKSAAALTRLGVSMFNVHAAGGPAMMSAAAESVAAEAAKLGVKAPSLIAVTVLTSINDKEWTALRQTAKIQEQVVHLAKLACESGLNGVVASAQEAREIRQTCGQSFQIVTPGIRPAGASADDQSRISTPGEALTAGASHLVIGRPITAAADPVKATIEIVSEMRDRL